jgi:hypothetical protein
VSIWPPRRRNVLLRQIRNRTRANLGMVGDWRRELEQADPELIGVLSGVVRVEAALQYLDRLAAVKLMLWRCAARWPRRHSTTARDGAKT